MDGSRLHMVVAYHQPRLAPRSVGEVFSRLSSQSGPWLSARWLAPFVRAGVYLLDQHVSRHICALIHKDLWSIPCRLLSAELEMFVVWIFCTDEAKLKRVYKLRGVVTWSDQDLKALQVTRKPTSQIQRASQQCLYQIHLHQWHFYLQKLRERWQ